MPILNQSSNIPGMFAEYKDGGLVLRRNNTDGATDSLLLMGTAVDGPIMTPVAVDIDTAEAIFGKGVKTNGKPNGATLPEAFMQAYKEGARDIRMMRISGKSAEVVLNAEELASGISTEIQRVNLGLVDGNLAKDFKLKHADIGRIVVPGSVQVFASNVLLDASAYIVTNNSGMTIIHLNENVASVGSVMTFKFDAYTIDALFDIVAEPVDIDAANYKVTLAYEPELRFLDKKPVITYAGSPLTILDINGMEVTVAEDLSLAVVGEVTADYIYLANDSITAEYSDEGVLENLAGQSIIIKAYDENGDEIVDFNIVDDAFKLYIDDREIIVDDNLFIVNEATKELTIFTENFAMNSSIELDFQISRVTEMNIPRLLIKSIFGGELYNEATVMVDNEKLVLTKPLIKKASSREDALEFKFEDYNTLGLLVEAINNNINNNVFEAEIDEDFEDVDSSTLLVQATIAFEKGEDGINLTTQEKFEKLSGQFDEAGQLIVAGAYHLLQNYKVDYVVPLGIHADDQLLGKYQNFASELALFCGIMSQIHMHMTHGVISMKPSRKNSLIDMEEYTKKLEVIENVYYMRAADGTIELDSEGQPFDMGGYISVIGGQKLLLSSTRLGDYIDEASVTYAAMLARLSGASAPTNKPFKAVKGIVNNFSVPQLNRLAANRLVTFQVRGSDNKLVVTDGITAAVAGSDYSRVTHSKIIRNCLKDIHEVAEPFIGEPINTVTNNALSSGINKKLELRANPMNGEISNYEFRLVITDESILLGDTRIELTIVPFGERRRITVVVGLRPSL